MPIRRFKTYYRFGSFSIPVAVVKSNQIRSTSGLVCEILGATYSPIWRGDKPSKEQEEQIQRLVGQEILVDVGVMGRDKDVFLGVINPTPDLIYSKTALDLEISIKEVI